MTVFASVDMEGVAGIVDRAQCLPGSDDCRGQAPATSSAILQNSRPWRN